MDHRRYRFELLMVIMFYRIWSQMDPQVSRLVITVESPNKENSISVKLKIWETQILGHSKSGETQNLQKLEIRERKSILRLISFEI